MTIREIAKRIGRCTKPTSTFLKNSNEYQKKNIEGGLKTASPAIEWRIIKEIIYPGTN